MLAKAVDTGKRSALATYFKVAIATLIPVTAQELQTTTIQAEALTASVSTQSQPCSCPSAATSQSALTPP